MEGEAGAGAGGEAVMEVFGVRTGAVTLGAKICAD